MILSKLFILDINFYMGDTAKRKKGIFQRQIHSIQTFQKFLLNYILIYPAPYTKLIDCLLTVFPKDLKGLHANFTEERVISYFLNICTIVHISYNELQNLQIYL